MIAASPIILHYAFSAMTFAAVNNICTFTHALITFINPQTTKRLMQEKGIFEYFKEAVTLKYKDFSGRARRREYWSYALCTFVIACVVGLIDGLIGQRNILSLIVSLALLLPSLAISLRRLQDIGKPWQYILFAFVPILGVLYLLYLGVQDSQPGDNAYGPNPKGL